jgi:hypothetical protein
MIKSKMIRWEGNVVHTERMRNSLKISAGKPEGKRPLRKPRRRG